MLFILDNYRFFFRIIVFFLSHRVVMYVDTESVFLRNIGTDYKATRYYSPEHNFNVSRTEILNSFTHTFDKNCVLDFNKQ